MGSCGVECLQGAHYGRKEPRGQVPAARAAADRLRPAEPSKPLQLLHHLNHPTSLSGVPHPERLPGRPRAAPEGSWDTAVCQPRPRSGRRAVHPNSPEPRAPTTGRGRPTHTQVTRHACVHTDTHAPTGGWERQVRDRRAARQRAPSVFPCRSGPGRGGALPRHPAGDVAAPGAPVGWKRGCSTGLGVGSGPSVRGSPEPAPMGLTLRIPSRIPPDRSTYPAILPLPLGSFARGTTLAFSPLPCRWREESCLFLCPAPGPSPASPAWPRAVGSPRSGRCLRPTAPLGLPAAAAEPRSTWRAAGRGRDGGGDRDAGDRPFTVPAAPRAAPRLRSRVASPAPGSSLAAEPGRQRAKPRRTAKVSGRRLAAAPRMVSAGGEGRRAVRSPQRPAGIPRRARGTGDRRLSAPAHRPIPFRDSDGTCRPPGPGAAESSAEAGERAAERPPQEEEEKKGGRPRSPGCQRDPALRRQLQAPSRLPLALAEPGGDGGFYFRKPPPLCLFDADIPPLQRTRLGPPS